MQAGNLHTFVLDGVRHPIPRQTLRTVIKRGLVVRHDEVPPRYEVTESGAQWMKEHGR